LNKRIFDIFLSIVLLPIILILVLIFSIILIFELKQFPFFIQERGITLTKFRFKIIKLRTIRRSDSKVKDQPILNTSVFYKFHFINDVPKFAGWLRRTGLDEIPQIINIIKGDMSFVGPRPFMLSDLKLLEKSDLELYKIRESFNSKPGVTGLWQIFCNREEGAKNLIALEKIYEEMKTVKYDLKILLYTLPIVLTANNADSIFCSTTFPRLNNLHFSNSTELEIVFNKSNSKLSSTGEKYNIRLPGDWWTIDRSLEFESNANKQLTLLKINTSSQKTA